MTAAEPFVSGDCARTSQPFDPPLELAAGDAVTVSLGYDLARSIVTGPPSSTPCAHSIDGIAHCFRACVDTGDASRVCLEFPDFAPTATRL